MKLTQEEYVKLIHKLEDVIVYLGDQLEEARNLLEISRDELYNSGMSPSLLAKITEFLDPTGCEENG